MITKITEEQQNKFNELMINWRDNASSEVDYAECEKSIDGMYKDMGQKPPPKRHFTSPLLSIIAAAFLQNRGSQLYSQLRRQLYSQYSQLHSQLYSQLRSQLYSQYSQLHSQLHRQLCRQLDSQLYSQLCSQLCSQLDSQLDRQLCSQLDSQLYSQLRSQLGSQYIGVWWGVWACYYEFGKYIGISFNQMKYNLFCNFVKNIHYCLPFEEVFIYSEKPQCHWSGTRLHNERGMAVEYADGWGWYALNGVRMKPEYVLTPADKLTPETILKEENVDQRRELLRKVGVERMVSSGKSIEKSNGYELLDMSPVFQGVGYAPHLLMRNPSLEDVFHLEGVSPECHTIQQALNWRAGNIEVDWLPEKLN